MLNEPVDCKQTIVSRSQMWIGLLIATLTLCVLVWGFGSRFGVLILQQEILGTTVKEGFEQNAVDHKEIRSKDAALEGRVIRLEVARDD